jgi:membrane protease YdiL (CAAX protease family)
MKRFFAFPLVRLAVIVVSVAALLAGIAVIEHGHHSIWTLVIVTWILAALLFGLITLVERLTTGRPPASIGFDPKGAVRGFVLGLALGAVLFSVVVLELTLGGDYRVTGIHVTWDLAIAALLLLAGAAVEEILFRGVLFRLIEEWSGTWIALAISAVLFGAAHSFNPGAGWISSVSIAVEAGLLLGAAFVVTKNLWFPIGLHFAWNFFEGPIYGTQVSGNTFGTSAMAAHVSGPLWLTGGSFGPEAGVGAIATCLVASIALLIYASRNSLIVRLPTSRHLSNNV